MKDQSPEIFCFSLENLNIAIPLAAVDQVLMASAVFTVPNSPPFIHGLIDYHGVIIPVMNLRSKLNLPEKEIRTSDIFIVSDTPERKIILVADKATGVVAPEKNELVAAASLDRGFEANGILRRNDGIILIYDIEKFLSADENFMLQKLIDNQIFENK